MLPCKSARERSLVYSPLWSVKLYSCIFIPHYLVKTASHMLCHCLEHLPGIFLFEPALDLTHIGLVCT